MSQSKLNPDIKSVWVGIAEMREVKVYPLSLPDHTENLPLILVDAYSNLQEELQTLPDFKKISDEEGKALLKTFKDLLYDNIESIMKLVIKEEDLPKPEELTSNQLFEFAETVFVVNYEGVLKNALDLFKRIKELKAKA